MSEDIVIDIDNHDPIEVVKRMRHIAGLDSDKKLAELLGIARQNIQQWNRKRGGVPLKYIREFSKRFNIDPVWLASGNGQPRRGGDVNTDLLTDVIEGVERVLSKKKIEMPADKKAKLITDLYIYHIDPKCENSEDTLLAMLLEAFIVKGYLRE